MPATTRPQRRPRRRSPGSPARKTAAGTSPRRPRPSRSSPQPPAEPPAEAGAAALEEDLLAVDPLPGVPPRVIQNASLSVTVPKGDFEQAIDRARQIAAALGGFVTSSQSSQGPEERLVRGSIVVRVPGDAYPQAMSQFAALGKVIGREESGTDVSLQYVDLEARASHLEAVERQLLGFLGETKTVADALIVQQRLSKVQLQLEEIEGRLRYLDDQTSFATISLAVAERGVPVAKLVEKDGGWSIGDAWEAAVNGIEKVAGGMLRVPRDRRPDPRRPRPRVPRRPSLRQTPAPTEAAGSGGVAVGLISSHLRVKGPPVGRPFTPVAAGRARKARPRRETPSTRA